MSSLWLINLPHNTSDRELREWIESRGIGAKSIRIARDLVAGVLSVIGRVELTDSSDPEEAVAILHGKRIRNQTVRARGSAEVNHSPDQV